MAFTTYPLNNIQYAAEDAELYNCTRKSGIYANDDFLCTVNGADNIVRIAPGIGWINNSKFAGKVIASKSPDTIDLGTADASLDRIDTVCIRFSTASNKTEFAVKKGTPASSPVIPAISQTAIVYELYLCTVYRHAGAVSVKSADVQDLRLDPMYCGLMADSVTTVDTQGINAQVKDLIKRLETEIKSVRDGSAYLPKLGGKMSGDIDMDSHKVKNLPTPTDNGDAIPKKYFDDNAGKDHVIAQGNSGNWYYRKWASGVAECWCNVFIASSVVLERLDSGAYVSGDYGGNPLPFAIKNPTFSIMLASGGGSSYTNYLGLEVGAFPGNADPQGTIDKVPQFRLTGDYPIRTGNVYAQITVRGTTA